MSKGVIVEHWEQGCSSEDVAAATRATTGAVAAATRCAGSSTGSAHLTGPQVSNVRTVLPAGNTASTAPKSPLASVMDMTSTPTPRQLVVIGGGMVARRLIDALRARDEAGQWP